MQTFHYFNRMQERIVDFVTKHSKISADRFRSLMLKTDEIATDMGSIIDGTQAVEEGLIDEVGTLSQAIECLKQMVKEKNNTECKIQNQ